MTPHQAAYRAGAIVAEIDARFGLTTAAVNNACSLPTRLPVVLRHVWKKAAAVPEVAALLDGFDPPGAVYAAAEQGSFWLGFYHQKAARDLPAGFGAKLQSLREAAGLSREQLAAAAAASRESVRLYETGARRPTMDALFALSKALGVPADTFRDS